MANITALEMTQDILSGHKASGYHYEEYVPEVPTTHEENAIYEFPYAIGFTDDGYDYWVDENGVTQSSWDSPPMDCIVAVFSTVKEAEVELAWEVHRTGATNWWLVENPRLSGYDLMCRYSPPQNWREVPHQQVR
jgi:hypothetical protein